MRKLIESVEQVNEAPQGELDFHQHAYDALIDADPGNIWPNIVLDGSTKEDGASYFGVAEMKVPKELTSFVKSMKITAKVDYSEKGPGSRTREGYYYGRATITLSINGNEVSQIKYTCDTTRKTGQLNPWKRVK